MPANGKSFARLAAAASGIRLCRGCKRKCFSEETPAFTQGLLTLKEQPFQC